MKSVSPIEKLLEDSDRRGELIPYLFSPENLACLQECGPTLCELHNSGKISLVSDGNLAAVEALAHNDFWSGMHMLDSAIPDLECSYREVLRLVQTLVSKAGSDGAAGLPNRSLVQWCKANPGKAKLIIEGAKSLDELCLSHCAFAIQGLGDIELAFELLKHSDQAVVAVGLHSLGKLEIDNEATAKRVIDDCFELIVSREVQGVSSTAIETAFKTWEKLGPSKPYRQKEFLETVIDKKKGDNLVHLSAALFFHPNGLVDESVDQILESLTGEVSDPQSVLHWLDSALNSKGKNWDMAKVIDVFAMQIPKIESSIDPGQFYNFCQCIWGGKDNAAQLFSNWLACGQFELCKFLADMLRVRGDGGRIVEISKAHLPADSDDQVFMLKKCIGFLYFNEVAAASILLSVVKNGKQSAREVAEQLLYDPLLLSYSGDLREFLEKTRTKKSKRISDCVQRVLQKHDAYLEGLKAVEHLVEFFPSIEQRRAAQMKDRELNNDIQRRAHEESIFSQLVSHQTLLYGKKSFSLIHGKDGQKVPNVTPLSEFSYSVEFPKLSVVDPVGINETLAFFRLEEKGS